MCISARQFMQGLNVFNTFCYPFIVTIVFVLVVTSLILIYWWRFAHSAAYHWVYFFVLICNIVYAKEHYLLWLFLGVCFSIFFFPFQLLLFVHCTPYPYHLVLIPFIFIQSLFSKYCSYTCYGINAVHFIVFFICSFVFIEKTNNTVRK